MPVSTCWLVGAGLVNALPQLINQAPTIIGQLATAIISNLPKILQAGIKIITILATGLVQAIPQLIGKIPAIISQIKSAFTSVNWGSVGMNIVKGIASGLTNAAKSLADAAANAAEAQNALFTVEEEPGMTNDFYMYGNFYVTGNQAYCQQFKDYGVYLGEKTLDDAAGGEVTLLEPVLFQSPIRELGHVEAQSETLKSADGSRELGSV